MDLSKTIEAKSDQLNSEDFIGTGPITVKITKVSGVAGDQQQPVAINYEGDNGKPYKPCKTCRRILVSIWGNDGASYVGKSMTLYRDPNVKFGGMDVGGIRISHMSDIEKPVTIALSVSKASRKPFTVQPLTVTPKPEPKAKENLTPEHPKWQGAKDALASGKTTIEKIKAAYELSGENEKLLTFNQ